MNRVTREAGRLAHVVATPNGPGPGRTAEEDAEAVADSFMAALMAVTQPPPAQTATTDTSDQSDASSDADEATDPDIAVSAVDTEIAADDPAPTVAASVQMDPAAPEESVETPDVLVEAAGPTVSTTASHDTALLRPRQKLPEVHAAITATIETSDADKRAAEILFRPDAIEELIAHHLHKGQVLDGERSVTRFGEEVPADDAVPQVPELSLAAETPPRAPTADPVAPSAAALSTANEADAIAAALDDAAGTALRTLQTPDMMQAAVRDPLQAPELAALPRVHWTPLNAPNVRLQVTTQVGQALQDGARSIDVQLDPPEWGHVRVRMVMERDEVKVLVHADHDFIKSALDGSIGDLKRMLAEQGLQLSSLQVDIGAGSGSQWESYAAQHDALTGGAAAARDDDAAAADPAPVRARDPRSSVVDAVA